MNRNYLCGTDQADMYILFEKLCARLQVRKRYEATIFDSSAFAVVFLLSINVVAAVLHDKLF